MLKSSIWELFNKIGCNTHAVRELLGEEGQVRVRIDKSWVVHVLAMSA